MTLAEGDGRIDGFERNLELHQDEIAGLQDARGAIDVRRRKIGVRALHDEDRVFAVRLDHDRRDPAGLPLHAPDMARIDPKRLKIAYGGVGEHVVANRRNHHDRGTQLGCGHRLIGSLPAVSHFEAWRLDGFTLDRHPIDIGDEVHHIAADDGDARLVCLSHFYCLSIVAGGRGRRLLSVECLEGANERGK